MLEEIRNLHHEEEFLSADGFDDAVIGYDEIGQRLIYSVNKCIEIIIAQGMSHEDAIEHFNYNVSGAYMGEQTPIWCRDDYEI